MKCTDRVHKLIHPKIGCGQHSWWPYLIVCWILRNLFDKMLSKNYFILSWFQLILLLCCFLWFQYILDIWLVVNLKVTRRGHCIGNIEGISSIHSGTSILECFSDIWNQLGTFKNVIGIIWFHRLVGFFEL